MASFGTGRLRGPFITRGRLSSPSFHTSCKRTPGYPFISDKIMDELSIDACEKCGINMRGMNYKGFTAKNMHVLCRPCLDKRELGAVTSIAVGIKREAGA